MIRKIALGSFLPALFLFSNAQAQAPDSTRKGAGHDMAITLGVGINASTTFGVPGQISSSTRPAVTIGMHLMRPKGIRHVLNLDIEPSTVRDINGNRVGGSLMRVGYEARKYFGQAGQRVQPYLGAWASGSLGAAFSGDGGFRYLSAGLAGGVSTGVQVNITERFFLETNLRLGLMDMRYANYRPSPGQGPVSNFGFGLARAHEVRVGFGVKF